MFFFQIAIKPYLLNTTLPLELQNLNIKWNLGNGGERHLKEYVMGKLIIHLFLKFKIFNFYGAIFFL
jgi:hypothetical protein